MVKTLNSPIVRPEDRVEYDLPAQLCDIAMKALEKDRTRRYESSSALAEDIERHLQAEPVTAAAAAEGGARAGPVPVCVCQRDDGLESHPGRAEGVSGRRGRGAGGRERRG